MISKNDIIVSKGKIKYHFKYLEWDTNFFDKTSYVLDIEKSVLGVDKDFIEEINQKLKNSFVTIKLPANVNSEILFFLQQCGFYYINTEVTLKYLPVNNSKNDYQKDIIVELVENKISLPYEQLGRVFTKTRFHEDINIDNKLADLLWVNYIKNYKPSPSHFIFLGKIQSKVFGVVLVNLNNDIANLFFVGVLEEFQGRKLGQKLIQEVLFYFRNHVITVGTQNTNIKALNFYIKNGFSLVDQTSTVLHCWS